MELLGDDERGYELARKLESCGVWRTWLGDSYYSNFVHSLSSHASWESFMRADDSKSKIQIQLQLRVRALLFDKAALTLFHPSNKIFSVSVSKLDPDYLQLHGDDVYFTLENSSQDEVQQLASNTTSSKNQSKCGFSAGSRYGESEFDNISQRFRNEELPETWYDQFIEKYRATRPYKLSLGDRELDKRTSEEMSAYFRLHEKHKRRHVPLQDDQYTTFGNSAVDNASNMHPNSALDVSNSMDSDIFLPETMFPWNCIPATSLLLTSIEKTNRKVEFNGVLDTLPQVTTRSPVMIERLGIRPEYLGMEQGGSLHHGNSDSEGNRKRFGEEQASQISQKVIARMLTAVGFEGATEVPLEALSDLLGNHICKLGRILKVLADNYRHECSALELVQMFLHATGHSNFGNLAELVKDGTRTVVQQSPQQLHATQLQQLDTMQPQQLDTTQPQQVNAMQPQQLNLTQLQQLNPMQPQQLDTTQPQQLNAMQPQQVNAMHPQQVNATQLQQLNPMQPQQVHATLSQQVHPTQLQLQSQLQSQMQSQHQSPLRLPQQMPRQMNQHMQQMGQPQTLALQQLNQQQLERLRMRQPSTPRPGMDMDKDRTMSQVSAENSLKLPLDANAVNASKSKESQLQFRQQALNAMSNLNAQSSNQYRQLTSAQIPQMQSPNTGVVRAPPLKVDGFQELMGGDASLKHDSEENKLTSSTSK